MRTSKFQPFGAIRSHLRASALCAGLVIAAATSAPAMAQDEEAASDITISANAAVVSDYRFRGLSFSDGDFAIQGGIDVSHSSGFYIGTWGSSIEDSPTFGHTEIDIYGGWSGDVAEGVAVDVGLLYYWYPNGEFGPSDYFEPYASVTTALGPVELTSGIAWAWSQDSLGNNDNVYIYTGFGVGIPNTPVSVSGNIGINDGSLGNPVGVFGDDNYVDWSLGIDVAITENLSLGVMYTDTDAPSVNDFTDSAIVFTLGASF